MCLQMATAQTSPDEQAAKLADIFEKFPQITENFHNFSRIGEGTFSTVYQGNYINENNFSLAFKVLVPTSGPDRVEKEIRMLQVLNGKQNVITLLTCMRHEDVYILVMPHFSHQKFQTFFLTFSPEDTQKYMRSLLEALKHIHQYNIIHRDIKPSNFLYNRISGQCRLVDFGLAQYLGVSDEAPADIRESCISLNRFKEVTLSSANWHPESIGCFDKHNDNEICNLCLSRPSQQVSRAGTPGFRAPEVLLKYSPHTVCIDIWAAGIILFSILSRRYPFFKSQDDITALGQIATIFGTTAVQTAAEAMHKKVTCQPHVKGFELAALCRDLRGVTAQTNKMDSQGINTSLKSQRTFPEVLDMVDGPGTSLKEDYSPTTSEKESEDIQSADLYPDSAYDLLRSLLELNPEARITANQALKHSFFQIDFSEQEITDFIEE